MFAVFLFFSLLLGVFGQNSDICVANPVTNLRLNSTGLLTWMEPSNCNISFYVVNIISEDNIIFHYDSNDTYFNASFLPICEKFQFKVTPIAEQNVQGDAVSIFSSIPADPGTNFTVNSLNITNKGRTVVLNWTLPDELQRCVSLFRVVVWDEDDNIPEDVYVEGNTFNFTAVPCMPYQFGVRAIYDPEEEQPVSLFNYTYPGTPTIPPALVNIREGVTSVNMTWVLESYVDNRCEILGIIIDASPSFNVSHPIEDSPERAPVAFEILNLQPNTAYISHVSVINTEGKSDSITVPLQTLPNSTFH